MNILSCVDFENCAMSLRFLLDRIKMVKECITFPISYSSRSIEWQKIYIPSL